jgi:hypothetical protein
MQLNNIFNALSAGTATYIFCHEGNPEMLLKLSVNNNN